MLSRMETLAVEDYLSVVDMALAEDVGSGDVTTMALISAGVEGAALMMAREDLVLAGVGVAEAVFRRAGEGITIRVLAEDGDWVTAGRGLMRVEGLVAPMLTGERVALNLVQRLCGVATLTRQFVKAVEGTGALILDTRKTTPGLRRLEKYAVRCGGGRNHRFGLYDAVLIKDNHWAALGGPRDGVMVEAVRRAREANPGLLVEVEADTLEQVEWAVEAGADVVLLDNMSVIELRLAVNQVRGRAKTEASGGVTLGTVRAIAETGVDYISVGALTHSARAMDVGLDWQVK
jgi:nicotinate-nucleotide pyrophosphorylase (carboxylating)